MGEQLVSVPKHLKSRTPELTVIGITLPSKEAQVANIRSLYESSKLSFDQTAYVECHGTGTQAGDWRELKAISETIATSRDAKDPIVVGSLKPNIGHLEGAAGVAGLIKGVLMLEHGKIPPNINFENPNPDIDFENWKIKVPTALMEWPKSGIRRVSVNCFGFGGTNAHVIMDEAPAHLASLGLEGNHMSIDTSTALMNGNMRSTPKESDRRPQLFCFSANEKLGARRVIDSQIPYIESVGSSATPELLENYAYTLGCRRSLMEWKCAVVASSFEELVARLKAIGPDTFARSSTEKKPRICFVFCGQGAQWATMGQSLMSFEAFRESLEAASRYMLSTLQSSFVLVDEIFKPKEESRISNPEISQPATTALQIALVDLLTSLSIHPTQVIGHSSGEIAAAFASGAISRETAWEVAYYRGLFAGIIPTKAPKLKGGMIAVQMSEKECREYLSSIGQSAQVAQIACINSPRSVTISGQADAIEFIAQDLHQKDTLHRVLAVKTAYHSDRMKVVEDDYRKALGHIETHSTGDITMFSSLTGKSIEGINLDGSYWVRNMIRPVQFLSAVRQMMALPSAERPSVIVELSPRTTLKSPTLEILADMDTKSGPAYCSVLNPKVDGVESLLRVIGDLWIRGHKVDTRSVITRGSCAPKLKCLIDLPPYPWNHSKSYWHESHLGEANRLREYPRQDLIGAPTADSIPYEPRWRGFLRISENPWIQDHQVQKTIIYPASGMVSMVLEGAKQMAKDQSFLFGYEVVNMRVGKAMLIPSTTHGLEMALNIKRDMDHLHDARLTGSHEFSIYSKKLDGPWERNASGTLRFRYRDGDWGANIRSICDKYSQLCQSCTEPVPPRQLYELLDTVGMNYGPLFQNIVEIRKTGNSCVANVRVPDTRCKMPAKFEYPHLIHPATLDSMFQTLFAIEPVPMVPTFIESLFVSSDLGQGGFGDFCGFSTAQRTGLGNARADISMQCNDDQSYVVVEGLHLTSIDGSNNGHGGFLPNHQNLCTEIVWEEDAAFAKPKNITECLYLLAHKYSGLSILQAGGGWDITKLVLDQLAPHGSNTPRLARYTIADTDDGSGRTAMKYLEGSNLRPYTELAKVDGSDPLADYHCVLVFPDSGVKPDSLKKHVKPGCWMISLRNPDLVTSSPSMVETDPLDATDILDEMVPARQDSSVAVDKPLDIVVLSTDECRADAHIFRDSVMSLLQADNIECGITVMPLAELGREASKATGRIVISLLDAAGSLDKAAFVYDWTQSDFEFFQTMQRVAKGIIWVTRSAHMQPSNPKGSPAIALGRTLMSEDPQKTFVTLDVSDQTSLRDREDGPLMAAGVLLWTFCHSGSGLKEMEFAGKGGRLYIPRLVTVDGLNKLIKDDGSNSGTVGVRFVGDHLGQSGQGLKLEITKPGISNDAFHFVNFKHPILLANEVEIQFERALLTFRDLEVVQGHASQPMVGLDLVGRVTRLGRNVSTRNFTPGISVIALVPNGTLQNVVSIDARFVTPARPGFVPSFFVSAYYALIHVGRIRAGSNVLIHAGASCFGLAAITVCAIVGAEVFVTVLGSDSDGQGKIVRGAGVHADRIIDGNSSNFVAAVKRATAGKGVDIVYNPTQENVNLSVECVRFSEFTFIDTLKSC